MAGVGTGEAVGEGVAVGCGEGVGVRVGEAVAVGSGEGVVWVWAKEWRLAQAWELV